MSIPLLILVTAIYFYVGIENMFKGNPGVALMFACYGGANVGFMWYMK